MPCPTCSHTLATLLNLGSGSYAHCERCGTIVVFERGVQMNVYRPKLVDRCRRFEGTLGKNWGDLWHRLGIDESINLPADRPR